MGISIAIDGPAGAGKSTIAKKLAKKMNYIYVDTGAMYRAIALYVIRKDITSDKVDEIKEVLDEISISIEYKDDTQIVYLNGENVNDYIRTEKVSIMTSDIATIPAVREKLIDLQRKLAKESNVIMDGRDIGTYVLKDANVKIYMTASSRTRAIRRYKEYIEKGIECDIDTVEQDIIKRDHQDMNRDVAPLKKANDAIELDTSNMNIDEVVASIEEICKENI